MVIEQIRKLAEDAVKVQNKLQMEAALREIVALCDSAGPMNAEQFVAAEVAQHRKARKSKEAA